jgi:AraC-like DNA-binding protein
MQMFHSCSDAIAACLDTKTYSMAHLLSSEHTMKVHIHDCCEVYYSISGGKKFLIDNRLYSFEPGDIFFINCNEGHHLLQVEAEKHERYVINIHPRFLMKHSSAQTDLSFCFNSVDRPTGHKLSLTPEEQERFLHLLAKLSKPVSGDYGADLLEHSAFLELMVFFNELFLTRIASMEKPTRLEKHSRKVNDVINYINKHLTEELGLNALSKRFSISPSHLNHTFKTETGTTLQKYVTMQRIAFAKSLLASGHSVTDAFSMSGFGDYSNFYKAFTKIVGISPKKYAKLSS